jgi:CPA1 family monovalent cation:H+ antiporter
LIIGFSLLLNPQQVKFTPQIIMLLLVPPLVFEAAFHIRFDDLRRDFWLIILLAVPGVVLTTLLVGWLVSWGTGLALQAALVFGAHCCNRSIAVVASAGWERRVVCRFCLNQKVF